MAEFWVTTVPLLYGSYTVTRGLGTFRLEPPLSLNLWEVGRCLNRRNALPLNNTWRIPAENSDNSTGPIPNLARAPLRRLPKMNWCASNKPGLLRHCRDPTTRSKQCEARESDARAERQKRQKTKARVSGAAASPAQAVVAQNKPAPAGTPSPLRQPCSSKRVKLAVATPTPASKPSDIGTGSMAQNSPVAAATPIPFFLLNCSTQYFQCSSGFECRRRQLENLCARQDAARKADRDRRFE